MDEAVAEEAALGTGAVAEGAARVVAGAATTSGFCGALAQAVKTKPSVIPVNGCNAFMTLGIEASPRFWATSIWFLRDGERARSRCS